MDKETFDKLLNLSSLGEFNQEILLLLKGGKTLKEILGYRQEELDQEYSYAMERFACREYSVASKLFIRLVLMDPQIKEYWVALGTTQAYLKEVEKALIFFSMASILDPKDPDPYYRSALCYLSLKQDKEAIKSLQLALTHSHNHPSFRSIELQSEEWLKKIGRG